MVPYLVAVFWQSDDALSLCILQKQTIYLKKRNLCDLFCCRSCLIRMLLPWNFHFAANVESHKILPFLFDLLRVKILSVEFLTILVIIFCFGSCLRLALYFYKLVRYRHLLHQLDPLDDIRILRIFSDILEEYHCTKQILIYQVPGLSSPAISGLIHPVILLPDREYSDQDLRFIFMHELNHYLHNDLWKIFSGNSLYVSTGGILFLI